MSVCLFVCLDVNQGGTNRNRWHFCTHRPTNGYFTELLGQHRKDIVCSIRCKLLTNCHTDTRFDLLSKVTGTKTLKSNVWFSDGPSSKLAKIYFCYTHLAVVYSYLRLIVIAYIQCEPKKTQKCFWCTVYKTWPIVIKFGTYCPE